MADIERRIERLENTAGAGAEAIWLVAVYEDANKPSEAAIERAKAEYKAEHPDWAGRTFNVLWVEEEATKANVQRVINGGRT